MAIVKRRRGRRRGSTKDLQIAKSPDCSKADTLKASAVSYFLKAGYSCFTELGVNSWGKLRADMLGVNLRQRLVICETKSSPRDYKTDTKWQGYLPFCNKFYFVMCPTTYTKLKKRLAEDLKGTGAGVMTLNPNTGYLDIVVKAQNREIEAETTMALITRMAWRGGISKRTNRRTRHYIREAANEDQAEIAEDKAAEEQPRTSTRRKRRTS